MGFIGLSACHRRPGGTTRELGFSGHRLSGKRAHAAIARAGSSLSITFNFETPGPSTLLSDGSHSAEGQGAGAEAGDWISLPSPGFIRVAPYHESRGGCFPEPPPHEPFPDLLRPQNAAGDGSDKEELGERNRHGVKDVVHRLGVDDEEVKDTTEQQVRFE